MSLVRDIKNGDFTVNGFRFTKAGEDEERVYFATTANHFQFYELMGSKKPTVVCITKGALLRNGARLAKRCCWNSERPIAQREYGNAYCLITSGGWDDFHGCASHIEARYAFIVHLEKSWL